MRHISLSLLFLSLFFFADHTSARRKETWVRGQRRRQLFRAYRGTRVMARLADWCSSAFGRPSFQPGGPHSDSDIERGFRSGRPRVAHGDMTEASGAISFGRCDMERCHRQFWHRIRPGPTRTKPQQASSRWRQQTKSRAPPENARQHMGFIPFVMISKFQACLYCFTQGH